MKLLKKQKNDSHKLEHFLAEKPRFQWIPMAIVAILLSNLFLTWQTKGDVRRLKQQQPYIYVQQENGDIVKAKPEDPLFRNEKVVANYVEDWLTLAFSWDLQSPNLYITATEERAKIPLPLYAASFGIIPSYRDAYLHSTAIRYKSKFPFVKYIAGSNQSRVRVFEEPIVEKTGQGIWKVTVVAHRTHSIEDKPIAEEKFNHVFTVRAIKPSNKRLKFKDSRFLSRVMTDMQDKGLQIIDIEQM